MDNEEINYNIKLMYLDDESWFIELGASLLVLFDEIEKVDINTEELFEKLNDMRCNC